MADSIESSRFDFRIHSMERVSRTRQVEEFRQEEDRGSGKEEHDGDEPESGEKKSIRLEDRYEKESLGTEENKPVVQENRHDSDDPGPGRRIDIVI